jgi:hypothetical protein
MTPKDHSEQLVKYFSEKLFKEGYPRAEINKLAIDFAKFTLEFSKSINNQMINDINLELTR